MKRRKGKSNSVNESNRIGKSISKNQKNKNKNESVTFTTIHDCLSGTVIVRIHILHLCTQYYTLHCVCYTLSQHIVFGTLLRDERILCHFIQTSPFFSVKSHINVCKPHFHQNLCASFDRDFSIADGLLLLFQWGDLFW